jgi:hypothetical protein
LVGAGFENGHNFPGEIRKGTLGLTVRQVDKVIEFLQRQCGASEEGLVAFNILNGSNSIRIHFVAVVAPLFLHGFDWHNLKRLVVVGRDGLALLAGARDPGEEVHFVDGMASGIALLLHDGAERHEGACELTGADMGSAGASPYRVFEDWNGAEVVDAGAAFEFGSEDGAKIGVGPLNVEREAFLELRDLMAQAAFFAVVGPDGLDRAASGCLQGPGTRL